MSSSQGLTLIRSSGCKALAQAGAMLVAHHRLFPWLTPLKSSWQLDESLGGAVRQLEPTPGCRAHGRHSGFGFGV